MTMYLHNRVTTTTAVISALIFLAHQAYTITVKDIIDVDKKGCIAKLLTDSGEQWIDLEDDLKLLDGELWVSNRLLLNLSGLLHFAAPSFCDKSKDDLRKLNVHNPAITCPSAFSVVDVLDPIGLADFYRGWWEKKTTVHTGQQNYSQNVSQVF